MSNQIKNKNKPNDINLNVNLGLVNNNFSEQKIILRYKNKSDIQKIDFLKKWCKSKNEKVNAYLANVVIEHIEDIMKKNLVPDLINTIYATSRKAIFAGTIGQNTFNAKLIKPAITQSEITDRKLNFIINLLCDQVNSEEFQNIHNPPSKYLEEHKKFKDIRNVIDSKFTKDIQRLRNRYVNSENNNKQFAEGISYSEFITGGSDDEKE